MGAGVPSNIQIDTSFTVNDGDIIRCEVYAANGNTTWGNIHYAPRIRFRGTFSGVTDTLVYHIPPQYHINNYAGTRLDTFYHKAFGPLYRGWGQFAYHMNYPDTSNRHTIKTERLLLPRWLTATSASQIDTSEVYLNIPQADVSNEARMSEAFSNIYNPLSDSTSWVEMTANTEFGAWLGYGNITYLNREMMANTRCLSYMPVDVGETTNSAAIDDYDYPVPNSIAGAPVNTIRKQNKSKLHNSSYGVGYIASMGVSESEGSNQIISDYMDMNGDGYPDFLAAGNIQYTMPWGGIGTHIYIDTLAYSTESVTESNRQTFGASYSLPKRTTTTRPSTAKISFDGNGSVGVSHGGGNDFTTFSYIDINGDGLPDRIEKKMNRTIALNVGDGFLEDVNFGSDFLSEGESSNFGMNIGANFDIAQASIGGGLGVNLSQNQTLKSFSDMNGDGLPDVVAANSTGLSVAYNMGNGVFTSAETLPVTDQISYGRSFSESVNLSVTAGFTFCSIAKVTAGVQVSPFNRTFSRDSLQLVDINGDGFVDCVTSHTEDRMTVHYNQAGKTNLLKRVTNFSGGCVSLDYELSPNSYEQPQRQWNLTRVETTDTLSPVPGSRTLTTFEYRNPHYDRYERMQFGYDTVITRQYDTENADSLYRYTVQGFHNYNFHKRGWKRSESVCDRQGHMYIETLYEQQLMDMTNGTPVGDTSCPGTLYVSYEAEITRYYEGLPTPQIVTEIVRRYDEKRNVVEYVTKGDTSHTGEYLRAVISYRKGLGHNLISLPDTLIVMDAQHDTLRKRTAVYDSCGRLVQIEQHYGDSIARYDFTHDLYGNVDTMTFPPNYLGQRMFREYKYDPMVSTYPTSISDAFGYSSAADYNYAYGKPTRITDMNGFDMLYLYDNYGRMTQLIAPNEAANSDPYTIRMSYMPHRIGATASPTHSYAVTRHYDCQHPNNPIETILLCDGWGRLLQTKKDAEISNAECLIVSGRVEYDCFGRTVKQYYPFTEPLTQTTYNSYVDSALVTLTAYDILDRPVKVKLPTQDSTTTVYGFGTHNGNTYFMTTNTDPNGIAMSTLTGTRKQQVKTIAPLGAVTTFEYDALGQLLQSTDPCGLSTLYTYDNLGRCLSRQHPDAGTDTYTYDAAGNLLAHTTQQLSATGDSIRYHYTYNRLDSVICPETPINNVYYTYGDSTAPQGQRGRVTFLEDASGYQTFFYGKMGEVIENNRTFVLPNENQPSSFKMKYSYDSWNRVQTITYPDGEVVRYEYNLGGMLREMEGQKGTQTFTYINDIRYNRFEQRDAVWYGNGTHVEYSYDTLLRLSRLESWDVLGPMQHVSYNYDRAGNITCIQNSAGMASATGLGGTYTMNYTYDSLYRLQSSTGGLNGMKDYSYWLDMAYEANGRILRKSQLARTFTSTSSDTLMNYAHLYSYGTLPVNSRVQSVTDTVAGNSQFFTWDANGNLLTQNSGTQTRAHCWDELNRLQGFSDAKYDACFLYDAGGERFYKFSGMPQAMLVNGQWSTYHTLTEPTLYASPYLVATPKGYTKHYYAESERVASKVGGGGLQGLHTIAGGVLESVVAAKKDSSLSHLQHIADCLGIEISYMKTNALANLDLLHDEDNNPLPESECYWYHPDHLSSASWVSDKAGKGIQYLYYLPWGEELANQRATGYESRYTFSGKERDEETGYSYFGARHYDSGLSLWLSVDPMLDKYPGVSPYVYCGDNPVRLVDEDGREWYINEEGYIKKGDNDDDHNLYFVKGKGDFFGTNQVNSDKKIVKFDIGKDVYQEIVPDEGKYKKDGKVEEYTSQSFDLSDVVTARNVFRAASLYTDVEWGFWGDETGTHLSTSHKDDTEITGAKSAGLAAERGTLLYYFHTHPRSEVQGLFSNEIDQNTYYQWKKQCPNLIFGIMHRGVLYDGSDLHPFRMKWDGTR